MGLAWIWLGPPLIKKSAVSRGSMERTDQSYIAETLYNCATFGG